MNYRIELFDGFKRDVKKLIKKYRNLKNDLKILQKELLSNNPKEIGIALGNSCYKIRVKNSDNRKGKSGGYRVIYYLIDSDELITLLSIYSKSDLENISENEIDKRVIELIKDVE
jgi:mRNA-degrading endonuclease RelE of RelBE toxin-antitoxin system